VSPVSKTRLLDRLAKESATLQNYINKSEIVILSVAFLFGGISSPFRSVQGNGNSPHRTKRRDLDRGTKHHVPKAQTAPRIAWPNKI
jgi:hypothetical protein